MNTRTGELAADVAWARPASIPVALILGYNGAARPTMAQVAAWGRPFLCGFESATTRAYAGGDAGEADAAFSCSSFDELGYPRECGSWVCAADSPSTPAQFLPNVREYGRRYALRQIAGGRSGPIAAYGNPAAVEALCAGIRDAGLVALRWGVGTWGYGEGRGPNMPPDDADCELMQSGNTPGPAEGTDLNWLYAPVSAFAPLGGPAAPPPAKKKGHHMELVISPTRALTHLGGVLDVLIPEDGGRVYGIPVAAQPIIAANPGLEVSRVGEETFSRLYAKLTASAAAVDVKALAKELAPLVNAGKVGPLKIEGTATPLG